MDFLMVVRGGYCSFMMEYICVGITFKLIKDRSKVNDTKHGEICIVTFLSILLLVKL